MNAANRKERSSMNAKLKSVAKGIAALVLVATVGALHGTANAQDTVKVGVLHSLTGTMAISEVTVENATKLAIDEINAAGGVNGKQISPVVEDGASEPGMF